MENNINLTKLIEEFKEIKKEHRRLIIQKSALVVPGSSVIRVFEKETKDDIVSVLQKIPMDKLRNLDNETGFKSWFEEQLDKITRALKKRNRKNTRVNPGIKWGHAAKILNLSLRDLVVDLRIFDTKTTKRLIPWLYCPIDGIIMRKIQGLGYSLPYKGIKNIDKKFFYNIQNLLGEAAKQANFHRVYFDYNWIQQREK
ncbi:hypothetical protein CEE37_13485 [candidate division LCP-89 bacterium B3_LCP]|uniref:Uncharacterized protein n=1 Tax=candidate division LCP-89 bacterium B3_LCP TaxID=2012998 RepID=A0A532USR0_UNCL8|nr:MAG: hypothetical protein CEE37_13485 [candidate division LCP-89 bacterium B3_LCP]